MSLLLQTLVLRGILFREQEHRQERWRCDDALYAAIREGCLGSGRLRDVLIVSELAFAFILMVSARGPARTTDSA